MSDTLRRYIAVVQDPCGYPSANLADDDAEAPTLYTVVKADEHEAEVARLQSEIALLREVCRTNGWPEFSGQ
jgi:hypothetical protein